MKDINYWKISPEDSKKDPVWWEKQWKKCLKEKKIAMGWSDVGDLSGLGLEQIRNRLHDIGKWKGNARQLFNFKSIGEGAIVVANKGQKEIAGIGKVVGGYYYTTKTDYFKHTLPVRWLDTNRRKIERQKDWTKTVIPLTKEKAQKLGVMKLSKTIQNYEKGIKKGEYFSKQVVKTRTFQQAFRNAILENYDYKCAVCDVDDYSLLEGCHIISAQEVPEDLSNGICLCVLHHAAFDKGIFSISDQYKILVADDWLKTTSSVLRFMISKLNGERIKVPFQKPPNRLYLKRHGEQHGF